MKPLFRSFLGLPLLLFLAACSGSESSPDERASTNTDVVTPTASAELQEPTPTSTTAPTRTPAPDPSPTPAPQPFTEAATIGADLLDLQTSMQSAVDAYGVPGVYSVAVTDLQTGETVGVRSGERHLSGCSMNLFVLYQVAADVEDGRYTLETVDALVRATTWSSNAKTAKDLYLIAGDGEGVEGVRRVQELIASLGLDDVLIDHPPAFHEHSLGIDFNNYVSAESMNRALAALWSGDIVESQMRDYLLEVLGEVKPGLNYLSAAVPEGAVSHKNGFFLGSNGYVDNDVGIIRLERGDKEYAYGFSFLSEQVQSEYGDVTLAQQLGALAYEAMAARYPLEDDKAT